jgi:hypothetical protein
MREHLMLTSSERRFALAVLRGGAALQFAQQPTGDGGVTDPLRVAPPRSTMSRNSAMLELRGT